MAVATVRIPNPLVHGSYDFAAPARLGGPPLPDTIEVKLGARLLPPEQKRAVPKFRSTFTAAAVPTPPESIDWLTKCKTAIGRMYGNADYGCCVISDIYHWIGLITGNDTTACVTVPDGEVISTYFRLSARPGQDVGCIPADVLRAWKTSGIPINGMTNRLKGFVAVDWRDKVESQVAAILFGGLRLAIDLPSEWANNPTIWQGPQTNIVGGHMVTIIDYNRDGVRLGTWGGTRLMPWETYLNLNRNTEVYATLSELWTNEDKLSPWGVSADRLAVALDMIGGNDIPDITPDGPPVPVPPGPTPPNPPAPVHPTLAIQLHGWFGSMTGTAVPIEAAVHAISAATGANFFVIVQDLYAIYAAYQTGSLAAVEAAVKKLLGDLGILNPTAARAIAAKVVTMTPEQWMQIAQVVIQAVVAILKLLGKL